MLEVLVAVVVLAIGLLGLAALQITGLRYLATANQSYLASLQVYDMADRMRANPIGVLNGDYNAISGIGSDPGCVSTSCTPALMAGTDAYQWNTANAALLPGGAGTVANNGNLFTITVTWNEPASFGHATQAASFSVSFQP